MSRVANAAFHALHFIEGPRSELSEGAYEYVQSQAAKSNVELYTISLECLADCVISFAPKEITVKDFAAVISIFAKEARVKDETIQHLKSVSDEMQS